MRHLQILLFAAVAVLPLGLPAAALAQRSPVVVELFTSQGCSSCPPADALLGELAAEPDVIALAFHVTVWDYLGWKDSFGMEANTRRQYAYAKAARERSISTPQVVVQGVDRLIGSDGEAIAASIAARQAMPPAAAIELSREGDTLEVALAPTGLAAAGPSEVMLVRFKDGERVAIEDGENAGYEIDYHNIVTDWTMLGRWDGLAPVEITAPLDGSENVAVIVQRERMGPVLSAARLP